VFENVSISPTHFGVEDYKMFNFIDKFKTTDHKDSVHLFFLFMTTALRNEIKQLSQ
jgi:hypothetical protein